MYHNKMSPDMSMEFCMLYVGIGISWVAMAAIICILITDNIETNKQFKELYDKSLELSKKVDELDNSTIDEDDIGVFRFMNGSSFYILDDDDEFVIVAPNIKSVRVTEILSVESTPITRNNPAGGVIIHAEDVEGDTIRLKLNGFYDDFERDVFKEFIEEYI